MSKKLSYKEVKHFIEVESESGCKLLSNDYTHNKSKLKLKCKCGEIFYKNWSKFNENERQCRKCKTITRKKSEKWTLEKMKVEFEKIHYSINRKVTRKDVYNQNIDLYRTIYRKFNNFKEFIEEIDRKDIFSDNNYYINWDKEKIKNELLKLHQNKLGFNRNENKALISACRRHYGSFEKALKIIGIKMTFRDSHNKKTTRNCDWNEDKIICEIKNLHQKKVPLYAKYIQYNYPSLYGASCYHIGGWKKAVEKAGLNYEKIKINSFLLSTAGIEFENILGKILTELHINFTKGYSDSIRPDFVLKNEHWIDAKLSESTIFDKRCGTIEKYEPNCKLLTIIYLRGRPKRDYMVTKKTRLISVHKLIKQLPKSKQAYFNNKLNNIEQYLLQPYDSIKDNKKCKEENCTDSIYSRGMCKKHYHRWYKLSKDHKEVCNKYIKQAK